MCVQSHMQASENMLVGEKIRSPIRTETETVQLRVACAHVTSAMLVEIRIEASEDVSAGITSYTMLYKP